jgi:hypothetical protein
MEQSRLDYTFKVFGRVNTASVDIYMSKGDYIIV